MVQPAWVSTRPALWTSRGNRRIFLQRQVRADFFTVFDSRGSLDRRVIGWISSALIRQMDVDNPLWGAPLIHGELATIVTDDPGAYDAATISRFTASGHERLRRRPVGVVSITGFVDTSRPHNTKDPRHPR